MYTLLIKTFFGENNDERTSENHFSRESNPIYIIFLVIYSRKV